MAGVKGRSGTNKGKDKPWAEALRLVGFREDAEGRRRLLAIAEKCYAAAESGEVSAMKEIGDRLDGKPAQAIDATINDERDLRDLSGTELAGRIADALARIEELTGRATGPDPRANGHSDILKLN